MDLSGTGASSSGLLGAPTATLINSDTGHHVAYVVKGETYKLELEGFDTGATVNLRVVLSSGLELPIGTISSFEGPSQLWSWTVGVLLPAGDYVSIRAYQQSQADKYAYSPEVMVEGTALESNIQDFLKNLGLNQDSGSSSSSTTTSSTEPNGGSNQYTEQTLERLQDLILKRAGGQRRRRYRQQRRRQAQRRTKTASRRDFSKRHRA